jgi:hypothetical protein
MRHSAESDTSPNRLSRLLYDADMFPPANSMVEALIARPTAFRLGQGGNPHGRSPVTRNKVRSLSGQKSGLAEEPSRCCAFCAADLDMSQAPAVRAEYLPSGTQKIQPRPRRPSHVVI